MGKRRKKSKKHSGLVSVVVLAVMILGCLGVFGKNGEESKPPADQMTDLEETIGEIDQKEVSEEPVQKSEQKEEMDDTDKESDLENPPIVDGKMTVHFLDVGQGLSVFVQCDGKNLIYDGGDRGSSSQVVAYLKNLDVTTIDYLISSHYDADHVSGLIGCLNVFDVKNVICADYVHDSKTYQSFISTVTEKGLEMQHPTVGTEYEFGSGSFTVLAPEQFRDGESNENSIAIRLVHGENSFLITGDAEHDSEDAMCRSGLELESTVLVPGHHGSATATTWDFLMKVVPEYAVISCGAGNSYGHPHEETMEKLEAMEVEVFRTDKQGYISVVSDGTHLEWSQQPCNDYSDGD